MTFVETIKIKDGVMYNLELHQRRMQKTGLIHFGVRPEIEVKNADIPMEYRSGLVKLRILYAAGILATEFHRYHFKRINSLQIVSGDGLSYLYKSTDRSALNKLLDLGKGADEVIIAQRQRLTDTTFSNLVFETPNGELFTPDTYLLPGTKRAGLLHKKSIKEKSITVGDLHLFKKVYLINALMDLDDDISVPISKIRL